MIERESFYAYYDEPKPTDSVLTRLNEWRREHRDVTILGVQWTEDISRVTCDVMFETPEEPTCK